METDHNYTYMEISEFGLDNAQCQYSTNDWEEFVGELDFDEITASVDHINLGKEYPRNT